MAFWPIFVTLWPLGHAAEREPVNMLTAGGFAPCLAELAPAALNQSAAGSAIGAGCWRRLAFLGVCRLREARVGPAGGMAP